MSLHTYGEASHCARELPSSHSTSSQIQEYYQVYKLANLPPFIPSPPTNMSISQETSARSEAPRSSPVIDAQSYQYQQEPQLPSETVQPGQVDVAPQQGATQPGSGTEAPVKVLPARRLSFKEKVVGYAKEIRGAALHKPETKEQGERILQGQEHFEPKKVGPGAHRDRSRSKSPTTKSDKPAPSSP
ncbi:unnamed protein product [Somion occarium]|uniref:Uncharacterized protein n=1 Tax=Somion occarium TaxID=3059160 RepID=A0ABP1E0I2_9APHY